MGRRVEQDCRNGALCALAAASSAAAARHTPGIGSVQCAGACTNKTCTTSLNGVLAACAPSQ